MRDTTHATSNVHVYTWSVDRLEKKIPQWPTLPTRERAEVLKGIPPDSEGHTHNVTCVDLHERHANALDPDAEGVGEVTHLALGDDATTPQTSNRSLNNEVARFVFTERDNNGTELVTRTFLDTGMANGESLLECGLVDDTNAKLWNHSLIDDPEGRLDPKTADVVATIIVSISWGDGA